jgi:hypothetical protein
MRRLPSPVKPSKYVENAFVAPACPASPAGREHVSRCFEAPRAPQNAITTILPLFYRTLKGYDATTAGLAVSPQGLGSLAGALIARPLPAAFPAPVHALSP